MRIIKTAFNFLFAGGIIEKMKERKKILDAIKLPTAERIDCELNYPIKHLCPHITKRVFNSVRFTEFVELLEANGYIEPYTWNGTERYRLRVDPKNLNGETIERTIGNDVLRTLRLSTPLAVAWYD